LHSALAHFVRVRKTWIPDVPIRQVCRKFVPLCRRPDLFSQALVAIDGSKFKAVNNRDRELRARQGGAPTRADRGERGPVGTKLGNSLLPNLSNHVSVLETLTYQIGQQAADLPSRQ
jgi:hypothetical protein